MSTRSIYIVDDDDSVRSALQGLLSIQSNLLIFGYRSGDDFLAAVDDLEPGCVLLDYDMPGQNGLDVLRKMGDREPKFAIVVLTGQGAISIAVQALKLGALDFLEKPCDPPTLMNVVTSAFATLEQDRHAISAVESAQSIIARLTPREKEVLAGLVEGRANKIIGYDLDISPRTVEIHRANMMQKLGVRSLPEALRIAFKAGFAPSD